MSVHLPFAGTTKLPDTFFVWVPLQVVLFDADDELAATATITAAAAGIAISIRAFLKDIPPPRIVVV
jgi:hypothetical protein